MPKQCRMRIVVGERPAQAPKGWVIYNAPRPICGDVEWRGEFAHGVFYAAIDPAVTTGEAEWKRDTNRQQDATILVYRAEQALYDAGIARLSAEYAGDTDAVAIIQGADNRSWVIDNQMDHEQAELEAAA